jgi:hypothetical protein
MLQIYEVTNPYVLNGRDPQYRYASPDTFKILLKGINKNDWLCLGILKKGWIHKHQHLLPAVLVLFADLNWNEPALDEKTRACAQEGLNLKPCSVQTGQHTGRSKLKVMCCPNWSAHRKVQT